MVGGGIMNKNFAASVLFGVLGLLVMIGSLFLVLTYSGNVLQAMIDFASSSNLSKLQQCGLAFPQQFVWIKSNLASTIMPFMYIGLPLTMVILSLIMFFCGYYYHKAKHEDDLKKVEEIERGMVLKAAHKVESEKYAASQPSSSSGESANTTFLGKRK